VDARVRKRCPDSPVALDGQLKLSVYFVNHAHARCGKIVSYEDIEWRELPSEWAIDMPNIPDEEKGKPVHVMKNMNIGDDRYLNLNENVITIKGVWDLCMISES